MRGPGFGPGRDKAPAPRSAYTEMEKPGGSEISDSGSFCWMGFIVSNEESSMSAATSSTRTRATRYNDLIYRKSAY
jgi:hypothetical protein